jgi:hypothetical protein
MLGVIVIVIFGLMTWMVMLMVTAWDVIVVFLVTIMDVHEAVAVFVLVLVKMVVLNVSMPMPVRMQVLMQMTMFVFVLHCEDGVTTTPTISVG